MKKIISHLLWFYYKTFYKVEVKGIENLPKKGRLIIAANHLSNNDPPLLLSIISRVRSDFGVLAKKELFKNRVFGYVLKKLGAIPTDRERINVSSVKKSIEMLLNEKCLLIFPEGTRKKDKDIKPKSGICYLVMKTKADVLPVKISYVKNCSKLGKIIVVFGSIIATHKYDFSDEKSQQDFPNYVMETIYSLS